MVRSPSVHYFIDNDSQSEVISGVSMRQFAHRLGRHVPRSATGVNHISDVAISVLVSRINRWQLSGYAEVCQFEVALLIKHQVLRLDVTVDNVLAMQILQSHQHTSYHELGFLLVEELERQMISEIASGAVVHH